MLFFAYAFPPSRAIGALRCWNVAKHLSRCGWDVEVVTLDPRLLANPEPGLDVHARCAKENIQLRGTDSNGRLLSGGWLKLRWWEPQLAARFCRRAAEFLRVDPTAGWVTAAEKVCATMQAGEVDAVFASAPPYTVFEAAASTARRLRAPLILDYRDLWSLNPHYQKFATEKIHRREARLLAMADGVTVVSPSMKDCLLERFNLPQPVAVVTNGFDRDEFETVEPAKFEDFAVVYAGRFYPPARTAEPLVAAIYRANQSTPAGKPVRLHYFGPDSRHVEELSTKLNANAFVKGHGQVQRRQVLAALKGADVAAVVTSVEATATRAEQGILTGKLFEAFGAGVPVLLISPENSDATRLVRESQTGEAFAGNAIEPMAAWLAAQRNAGERNGIAGAKGRAFSWPQLAERLDSFLTELSFSHGKVVGRTR